MESGSEKFVCCEVAVCGRGNVLCGGVAQARYTDAHPQARGVGDGMAMRRSRLLTTREFPERRCRDHGIVACVMRPGPHYDEARRGPAHPPCHGVRPQKSAGSSTPPGKVYFDYLGKVRCQLVSTGL